MDKFHKELELEKNITSIFFKSSAIRFFLKPDKPVHKYNTYTGCDRDLKCK